MRIAMDKRATIETLQTAPWGSPEILDAVERAIDEGWANEAERVLDEREQVEEITFKYKNS
jgi:hypothetical protein